MLVGLSGHLRNGAPNGGGGGGPPAPSFDTQVLLHFDSTPLVESANGLTSTASGSGLDGTVSQFGPACWQMGGGNFRIDGLPDISALDWTMEWWWRLAGTGARPGMYLRGTSDEERVTLGAQAAGGNNMVLIVRDSTGTAMLQIQFDADHTVDVFKHVAISYDAATKTIYVGQAGAILYSSVLPNHPGEINDLYHEETFGAAITRIDELRLITGAALYKDTYIPPVAEFEV